MFRASALNLCRYIDTKSWYWLVSAQRAAPTGGPDKSVMDPCVITERWAALVSPSNIDTALCARYKSPGDRLRHASARMVYLSVLIAFYLKS